MRAIHCFLLVSWMAGPSFGADGDLADVNATVREYCLDCHAGDAPDGGLDLSTFDATRAQPTRAGWDTTTWEKVVAKLQSRQMPPVGNERPSEASFRATVAAMVDVLDRHAEKHPRPGRTESVRRLNRTEYRNAVRDLLAVNVDVDDLLPADQLAHGFDNVTVGDLTPVQMSRYLVAAEKIARLAVGGPSKSPGGVTVRVPADRSQDSHVEGLPLGTRGGTRFEHHFPADGVYEFQLKLMRDRDEKIEGLGGPEQVDVLLDRGLVRRFTVKPLKGSGPGYERDDTLVDAHLVGRFRVTAGPHDVGVTFPRKDHSLLEIKREPFDASFNKHRHPRRGPALFQISIVGPFDPEGPGTTPSRAQVFVTTPTDPTDPAEARTAAESNLRRLMRLAYRRPITDEDLSVPMRFFEQRSRVDGFEAGIETALTAVLVNPHFLLRAERDPDDSEPGEAYRITDLELASRLSFFLWSSLPDDELLDLAEAGRLHEPDVLRKQTRRMLADVRSRSLATNFAAQWLYLRNLDSFTPDRRLFPSFDDNLRKSMRRETELLFESVIREDRSVLDLIATDTTYLDERLARHYGITSVLGSEFRPVKVDPGTHRGGLLRHASILAVTSYATRTSPTVRGSWVLENVLGTPPPPPPPNVPTLQEKPAAAAALTIRERLAEHRENPACASCHDLIDPVGFALENYDAVGRWRRFDAGQPIDATGRLPDGTELTSLADLETGLLARPRMFVGTLTEKLLVFALGRGVEVRDAPTIRRIVREAAEEKYRFAALVEAIVTSRAFEMRER